MEAIIEREYNLESSNETEWVEALCQGDNQAFRRLVHAYNRKVYNLVYNILRSEEDAEDVAQEVFIKVFESIHGFKRESKLGTWIYRIAYMMALDFLRRKKRKKRFAFIYRLIGTEVDDWVLHSGSYVHPGCALESKESAQWLFKCLDELPENQKTAVMLHKLDGLSYQEVSEVMQTSLSAVESLIHRGKQNLMKKMNRNQNE